MSRWAFPEFPNAFQPGFGIALQNEAVTAPFRTLPLSYSLVILSLDAVQSRHIENVLKETINNQVNALI